MRSSAMESARRAGLGRIRLLLPTLLVAGGVAGCAGVHLNAGSPPRTDALATLVSGNSTARDVRSALGPPRGYGLMRHRPDEPLRRIWYYEQMQASTGGQSSLYVLVVFLDRDEKLYDGYWWFRSNALVSGLEQ